MPTNIRAANGLNPAAKGLESKTRRPNLQKTIIPAKNGIQKTTGRRNRRTTLSTCLAAGLVVLLWLSLCACVTTGGNTRGASHGPASVAVWDFEALGPMNAAQTAMGEMMAARIVDRFNQSPAFEVVEREQLIRLLEEQKLGSSKLVDERTRLTLGRIIGCRQMVFGAYQLLGDTMRLDLRLVDVSSGKVLKTADAAVPAHSVVLWLDTADSAAGDLIEP